MIPNPYERPISADDAGQRIDNFLLRVLKGVPRSRIYRAITSGEVRINKKRVKPSDRIETGDMVRVPPIRTTLSRPAQNVSDNLAQMLRDRIVYEDKNFLVLNKPCGIAVHGGSGINLGIIEALRLIYPQEANLELVHRLDRETSGCLMIAKKRSMLRFLHEALREGLVQKKYQTLLVGHWPSDEPFVDAPLEKSILTSGERMVRVSEEGKPAKTLFKPLQAFKDFTLMEAMPLTGRTHQIRVHAAHVGNPVAADEKYGNKEANLQARQLGLKRLFLHAVQLVIPMPEGTHITIDAPLDESLVHFLGKLS
jgi:23S rRNA pseudouridine955/2504/2580 synthase